MKKMSNKESLETRVSRFLFKYRITPHSTTGRAPAEMLMSRKPRSRFDILHPDVRQTEEAERVQHYTINMQWIDNYDQLEDDRKVHRHQDQVIHRETPEENENDVMDPDINQQPVPDKQVVSEENAVPAARDPQRDRQTPDYYL
ncbi:Hypothetical predicted protein [Paramuricea clavata]|uniref:Uncharacterized protein n=1 Tax=Paramuricea clavata TaxID=317549 RepID=A0A6S7GRH7_PARCT|nr:Hypothetical predicted protein [Paramuricea clavata]